MLARAVGASVAGVSARRPDFDPARVAAAGARLSRAVERHGLTAAEARPVSARSSVIVELCGGVVVKASVLEHQAGLEAAGLSAWGAAGLTPRLLGHDAELMTLWMTRVPGLPLHQDDAGDATGAVLEWYRRCAASRPVPSRALSCAQAVREWSSWLGGHHPICRDHATRAGAEIERLVYARTTSVTQGDPNTGNFLHDRKRGRLVGLDPLPSYLAPELALARAAVQLRPGDPEAFLVRVTPTDRIDTELARRLLEPLAVFALDWVQTPAVTALATAFAQPR